MANYTGYARSNYVRFDPDKLEVLEFLFPVTSYTHEGTGLTCILSDDEVGTPGCELFDDPNLIMAYETLTGSKCLDTEDRIEFLDVVHHAFADDPGGLFVWQEVGFENLRYLTGVAIAIDATGEVINQVSISDIYQTEDVNTYAEY